MAIVLRVFIGFTIGLVIGMFVGSRLTHSQLNDDDDGSIQ